MYLNPAGSELLSTDIDQLRANIRASGGMGHVMTGDISEFQSLRFVGFHGLERWSDTELNYFLRCFFFVCIKEI